MNKMDGMSMDLTAENVARLKAIFPEAVTEGKVDFNVLKSLLGGEIENRQEYYKFTWNGKEAARQYARQRSMGTLRPCSEESVGADGTPGKFDSENLYIEGDNLEVLKLLQGGYHSSIKMIYFDPPYNTGHDFVYPDNYRNSIGNYKELTRQTDDEGRATRANPETSGRYHTDWLNMMYPRLILAQNLLSDDGVVFISIDDSEQDNLKKLCNEVFGEENFVANIVWQKRTSPDARKIISAGHEYLLMFSKNIDHVNSALNLLDLSEEDRKAFKNPDNDPRGPWVSSDFTAQGYRPNQMYTITTPGGAVYTPPAGHCWKNLEPLYLQQVAEGRFWFGADGKSVPRRKTYLSERQGKNLWTWWPNSEVGHTQEATQEIKLLFDEKTVFDFPKPVRLLARTLQLTSKNNDIVLDFFAGTSTLAHAVMQLNAEDGGHRHFIMVQLPEPCADDTEAAKAGYKNICEIGKERIRRAAKKIREEKPLLAQTQDMGFKVFKLDTSNLLPWNPNPEKLAEDLFAAVNNVLTGRTTQDLLYEILLKCNLPLTLPIEEKKVGDNTVYIVGEGALAICLDEKIPIDVAEAIVGFKTEYDPIVPMQVVFRDNGFDDVTKTNTLQILKQNGFDEKSIQTI
ncbi:MAG: site-specific DNA-methyltransferase [Victivallales bacterium]|nr:site-specific DNA-methyltransferase [Victivallales bacterium]